MNNKEVKKIIIEDFKNDYFERAKERIIKDGYLKSVMFLLGLEDNDINQVKSTTFPIPEVLVKNESILFNQALPDLLQQYVHSKGITLLALIYAQEGWFRSIPKEVRQELPSDLSTVNLDEVEGAEKVDTLFTMFLSEEEKRFYTHQVIREIADNEHGKKEVSVQLEVLDAGQKGAEGVDKDLIMTFNRFV